MAKAAAQGQPGADADKPSEIPAPGWKQIAKRAYKESNDDNVSLIAAGVAFYAFLAFVPLLATMVLTYGLVAEPASVVSHMQALTQAMPQDAAKIIGDQLKSIVTDAGSKKGIGLLIAIALSLYGAMKGMAAIVTATNIVWDVEESRSFLKRTALNLILTVGAVLGLLLAVVGISVLGFIDHLLPTSAPIVHTLLKIGFWVLAAAAVSFGVAIIYRYAPNRPKPEWKWISPGSVIATVVWLISTAAFGFYVANFGSYNATYGSLGAVIVFLTWIYLTAYILLMGAELNAETERQTDKETLEKEQGGSGSKSKSEEDSPAEELRKKERQRRGWEGSAGSEDDPPPSDWVPGRAR
ncbi:MAG TPA: YihY/virulence factor BrkB family protein [Allosphingosinicella sp.]|nr:YihY/virulence factor BrkB family protein [Allosphingosinicella sp.]